MEGIAIVNFGLLVAGGVAMKSCRRRESARDVTFPFRKPRQNSLISALSPTRLAWPLLYHPGPSPNGEVPNAILEASPERVES